MSMSTQISTKRTAPRWLMMNSRGSADGMWTLLVISFMTTTFAYVASLIEVIEIGDFTLAFRGFDALGYAAVVLIPLIGGYFGRRYTKAQTALSVATARVYAETSKSTSAHSQRTNVKKTTMTARKQSNDVPDAVIDAANAADADDIDEMELA